MHLANNKNLHIYGHCAEKYCLLAPKQAENISSIYLFIYVFV